MSNNGVHCRQKHGGPHTETHESTVLISTHGSTVGIVDKSGIYQEQVLEDSGQVIQDGDIAKSSHDMDSLLHANSDSEDMATFETTIAGSNPEWIKTKLSSMGSIFTDSLDLADKVKEIDELFARSNSPGDPSISGLGSDSSVFTNNTVLTLAASEKKTHSSPCSPSQNFLQVPTPNRSRSYSDGADCSTLNAQERACLEEIEKGSQLTPEDEELLKTRGLELQQLEFQGLDNDKSNMLMTPQELEQMPDQGIEFEESVGPKLAQGGGNILDGHVSLLNKNNSSNVSTIKSEGQPLQDSVPQFTQILVSTPQGQQIFQISNAEIAKLGLTVLNPLTDDGQSESGDPQANQITIQDGFLVIPVSLAPDDENGVPNSVTTAYQDETDDSTNDDDGDMRPVIGENGIGKVWQCTAQGCGRVFTKPSKLKIHYMRHTGERPYKCESPGCDWAFTTAYQLKRHEECHQKKKEFVCDMEGCGRRFTTKYNLNAHYKLHDRPCTEMCTVCGKMFPTIRLLDAHLKEHENAPKSYKCPYEGCNKYFFSKHCMGSHARVHTEDRDLQCKFEGCGRVFDKQCRLKQHMRSHTGERPYVCQFEGCGWAFSTGSKLKRHERKHTGDRKFVCPVEGCNKPFLRAEHLKGHMVTHSGQKPFDCTVQGCQAKFTTKSSMHTHLKKHNEPKEKITYFCPIEGCNKKYNHKTGLRSHIAKHYKEYQVQIGPAGNVVSLINPELLTTEDFDAMAFTETTEMTTASESSNQSSTSEVPQDNPIIHIDPANLIDAEVVGPSPCFSNLNLTLPNGTQLIVARENQPLDIASTTDSDLSQLILASSQAESRVLLSTNINVMSPFPEGGSARTDYRANEILSLKARQRQKMLKERIKIDYSPFADSNDSTAATSSTSDNTSEALTGYTSPELMLARGITFRDPETGAIYVQTQLLQDDPPNGDLYDDSMDTADPDLSMAMLQGVADVSQFPGTTINLQDLE